LAQYNAVVGRTPASEAAGVCICVGIGPCCRAGEVSRFPLTGS
jgi:hypothetical protein